MNPKITVTDETKEIIAAYLERQYRRKEKRNEKKKAKKVDYEYSIIKKK